MEFISCPCDRREWSPRAWPRRVLPGRVHWTRVVALAGVAIQGVLAAALCTRADSVTKSQPVHEYRPLFAVCPIQSGRSLIVLRSFWQNGRGFLLAVDPENLATRLLPEEGLLLQEESFERLRELFKDSPYGRALVDCERRATAKQDAGLVHAMPRGHGVVLTIDLCPSKLPLDRAFLSAILLNFAPEEKPVPLGIAITGRWMQEHPKDLAWVEHLERDGEVLVTWINHSFNHRYRRDLPLSKNFLLEAGTDLDFEVLATEKAMIENDLRPSIFFRFPGLISDAQLVRRVLGLGLITVGSDAWLAKNQPALPGSIVLVHGNGNEPIGIQKFLSLVRSEQQAIRKKDWLLFDLRESIQREEGIR